MKGSVFKRCPHGGTVVNARGQRVACKCGEGSWAYRIDLGKDPVTGKRRQPQQGKFKTQDAAQRALTKVVAELNAGTYAEDQGVTVADWLTTWLNEFRERVATDDRAVKTYRGYEAHVRLYLIPHLGSVKLRDLRNSHVEGMIRALMRAPEPVLGPVDVAWPGAPDDMQAVVDRYLAGERVQDIAADTGRAASTVWRYLQKSGARRVDAPTNGRGSSPKARKAPRTLDGVRRTLRAALEAAVRRGLVSRNVAAGRLDSMPRIRRADTKWWQPKEVAAFLLHVHGERHRLAAMFELAAFAGMRRAELLGLRWCDVDDDLGGLVVRNTLAGDNGPHACMYCPDVHVGRRFKEPKTDASARWVPLVGGPKAALRKHREVQDLERMEHGVNYQDHGLVFCYENGEPLRPTLVTDWFDESASAAGLPHIRLHDMRHGAASLMVAAGVPIDTVALILGHASSAVTQRIYSHVLKDPAREAAELAERLVRPEETT